MDINQKKISARGIKFSITKDKKEIARAFLYIMHNDLHKEPFGLMEDVYVQENYRRKGLGTKIVKQLIKTAQKEHCYKLIATSRYDRPKVHELYTKLGFKKQGLEFRIDFQ